MNTKVAKLHINANSKEISLIRVITFWVNINLQFCIVHDSSNIHLLIMDTTTKVKLTYFHARGRAELSRLILAQAGVDYQDVRIAREDWPKIKPSKFLLVSFSMMHINPNSTGSSIYILDHYRQKPRKNSNYKLQD